MGKPIQVFEYERLKANDVSFFPNEKVGKKVIERLWQYNDANDNIYFEAIRNGVKFKQFVGVIQIGNITIEILPKADREKAYENDRTVWHNILLKMLAKCKKVRVDSVSEASLKKRYHSLLDLYFEVFLKEVNSILENGLIKQYRKDSGNLKALKGRLDFSKNTQQNFIHKERFYTIHQVYDYNNLINQILFRALIILKNITNNVALKDGVSRTLAKFPSIDDIEVNKKHFDKVVTNRKTLMYEEALKIAKMIILNYSPDIKGGNENMLALLFDMNKLWEEYVFRTLTKHQNENLKVSFQNSTNFWENKKIKPDIVISKKDEVGMETNFVIDTKWKIIDPTKPSDDDLKQMYAYNLYWDAPKSMLLYPSSNPQSTSYGTFHRGRQGENKCKLGFVKVMKAGSLNPMLGDEILAMLN
ncbi:McrC family protein [Seonamhaeicola maritimus]|uniref:Restriction endonuclease n=1 Tax=Seonamhaeicola maritimus TaxID=2591822 RepID=A0A5C7GGV9_9FLAO|nr:restriction endonuclease [Seonamhaeicola maritimus]TXG36970.1 restriction endonuclease [Seonamhaeicola maritimus]